MPLQKRSSYALTVDCVIFGFIQGELKVALIERKKAPFVGSWALPGGFVTDDETVEEAARRELQEETGINDIYLEQFQVFSKPDRDPRGRVVTVGFFALIAADTIDLVATADAASAQWYPAYDLPQLAFDHAQIYAKALEALRIAIQIKPLVFELLPQHFTLTMLQHIYEQILGVTLDKRNFRKKIANMEFIELTKATTQGSQHRPARLYRFNHKRYAKNYSLMPYSIY